MQKTATFDHQTFIPEILNVSGLGILILDENRQVLWCNGQFAQWVGDSVDNLIGQNWIKLPLELSDEHGEVYYLYNQEHTQSMNLQHWKALLPSQPRYTAHFFKSLISEPRAEDNKPLLTGIPQRPNWSQFLDYEISRSRRYQNPLTILKVKLVDFGSAESPLINNETNDLISQVLKDELRWADMIGFSETGEFLVILPETPASVVQPLTSKILQSVKHRMKKQFGERDFELVIGETHWQKGDSSATLLERVRDDLLQKLHQLMQKYQAE